MEEKIVMNRIIKILHPNKPTAHIGLQQMGLKE